MTDPSPSPWPPIASRLIWALLFIGLPMAVAGWESRRQAADAPARLAAVHAARGKRPKTPPPAVEPVKVYALERDQAVALNAAIPFSRDPNPAALPFIFSGTETDLARAVDCLAAAEIYEAGDDAVGEQAVAQVVLNRARHPAFPKTVCGVVFQGQERSTGCQFTFSCDGALARAPGPAAWARAQDIARSALAGKVYAPVGHATHYHTDWVVPYWSDSLDKITAIGTHLFFRWRGWWGTPAAFRRRTDSGEPLVTRIASLSIAHRDMAIATSDAASPVGDSADAIAAQARRAIGLDQIGKTVAGVRLIALADTRSFIVELPKGSKAESWPESARTFCAGRPQCRVMGWTAADAPKELPLTLVNLASMRFSYIHDIQSGLQRALWNCATNPRTAKNECMRQRMPVVATPEQGDSGLAGVRRKERFENVKIVPPAPAVTLRAANP